MLSPDLFEANVTLDGKGLFPAGSLSSSYNAPSNSGYKPWGDMHAGRPPGFLTVRAEKR